MRAHRRARTTGIALGALAVLTVVATAVPAAAAGVPTTTTTTSSESVTRAAGAAPDPSLAEMDATGDHAMGASIAAHADQTAVAAGVPATAGTAADTSAQSRVAAAGGPPPGKVQGMDVSAWQPSVDFGAAYAAGARFAFVKVSEGTTYQSATYRQQWKAAGVAGMIRGGYVYAQPGQATGKATANAFFRAGGYWKDDRNTMPPVLDIEYGSASQGTCYRMGAGNMRNWIRAFSDTVYQRVGRYPIIYTTTDWWKRCTNNAASFPQNPLWVALYPSHDFTTPGTLGASFSRWTFWQWAAAGTFPGDQDVYWYTVSHLRAFSARHD